MNKNEIRDFAVIHFLFTGLSVIVFLADLPVGWKFFMLTVTYITGLPVYALLKGYKNWIQYWKFLLPLSIFQVFPDWFLSAQLNVLVFPEDGFYKLGTVSAYMAGLWLIPLFIILFTGKILEQKYKTGITLLVVAAVSLIVFGGSEAMLWRLGSWYAQNVRMVYHTAIYVLFPEIILGVCTYLSYNLIKDKGFLIKTVSAFLVMLIYTGALMFFYFFLK